VGGIDFYFRLEGSGLLNQEKFLPLFAMGSRIELTLESASTGLRTGTEYVVSNSKIYYIVLTMSDQLAAKMSEARYIFLILLSHTSRILVIRLPTMLHSHNPIFGSKTCFQSFVWPLLCQQTKPRSISFQRSCIAVVRVFNIATMISITLSRSSTMPRGLTMSPE